MDESLWIFSIEAGSGDLQPLGAVDVMGKNPRHFAIAPGGEWLLVGNQDSGDLTVFRIEDDWPGSSRPADASLSPVHGRRLLRSLYGGRAA